MVVEVLTKVVLAPVLAVEEHVDVAAVGVGVPKVQHGLVVPTGSQVRAVRRGRRVVEEGVVCAHAQRKPLERVGCRDGGIVGSGEDRVVKAGLAPFRAELQPQAVLVVTDRVATDLFGSSVNLEAFGAIGEDHLDRDRRLDGLVPGEARGVVGVGRGKGDDRQRLKAGGDRGPVRTDDARVHAGLVRNVVDEQVGAGHRFRRRPTVADRDGPKHRGRRNGDRRVVHRACRRRWR